MSEDFKETKPSEKIKMTDQERIELATKLDKELDNFISGLEKKADKWKEGAEWHKEMENHPFFMKTLPNDGEVSPLVEGLQQLKYSTEENSPEELAISYKEDGNFNFQCKNYRMAIISYTEGLSQKISNPELQAQLLNNRAAAHWELKNFRSCYNDCKAALNASPIYVKAERRLAQVCCELGLFDECVELCDKILNGSVDDKLSAVKLKALKQKNIRDRNSRKEQVKKKKEEIKKSALKKMIEERGIKFFDKPCWEQHETVLSQTVQIDGDHLIWPVIILYPEYKTSDVIENFHENNTFIEQLDIIFEQPPEWDAECKYTPKSIVVHYEDVDGKIHLVKKSSTLGSVLKEPHFRVDGNTPSFIVHAKETEAYKQFLNHYK
ncbi:DNA polymerase interacting tetratricopeptide repeat-containing, protein of 47 kDa isoform X3 [Halyomorpha halys]|uniref:DNA polymerase interacting tetratricopeptide repeat-containing, protein of 47 kDa isoform X3 n=1 Tax=Halyomorpha halys TaxID=286706 RepID=UPI0006D4D601|nr:tetratricopeptide repeat protein 4 [Halyomorpha halys]